MYLKLLGTYSYLQLCYDTGIIIVPTYDTYICIAHTTTTMMKATMPNSIETISKPARPCRYCASGLVHSQSCTGPPAVK